MSAPDGWTDDMTIRIGRGTLTELVRFVLASLLAKTPHEVLVQGLAARFAVDRDDAELALRPGSGRCSACWDREPGEPSRL